MRQTKPFFPLAVFLLIVVCLVSDRCEAQTRSNVVAFWSFEDDYDFSDGADGPNRQNFTTGGLNGRSSTEDFTVSNNANLQAYLGNAAELDENGGGGFVPYTSQASGVTYGPSRTLRFRDLRGGGDDFSIGTENTFAFDRNDGAGVTTGEDFSNDALLYLTLDGAGFQDFQLRFDAEGTPGFDPLDPGASDLPTSFDVFYRTTGAGGTWFRDTIHNNIDLVFSDLDPANPDPDNQVADSGLITLNAALNNNSQIEIIINDFANEGNEELELDNIEVVANVVGVPEPNTVGLIFMAGLGLAGFRRRS